VIISNTKTLEHPKIRAFFYGPTGSGKTTAASTFPRPLFLTPANEGSELTLAGRDFDVIKLGIDDNGRQTPIRPHISSVLTELDQRLQTAMRAKTDAEVVAAFPWETLVLESLTHYCDLVVEDVSNKGQKKMDQLGWGKVSTHLRTVYNRLNNLDCHVVLTSLEKVSVTSDGAAVGGPNVTGSMAVKLPSACDIIGYCRTLPAQRPSEPPTYRIHFQQHGPFAARSRFRGFPPYLDDFNFSSVEPFLAGVQ